MTRKRVMQWGVRALVLGAALGGAGCSGDGFPSAPPDRDLENTVFPGAEGFIVVGEPAFEAVTGPTPTFTWAATGQRFVFLGVFDEKIVVRDRAIVNFRDNIWAWHSGLGTAREGAVAWGDGVDVVDGDPRSGSPPTPLTVGRGYVWAVWAWDDEGAFVTHASQEMYFTVE